VRNVWLYTAVGVSAQCMVIYGSGCQCAMYGYIRQWVSVRNVLLYTAVGVSAQCMVIYDSRCQICCSGPDSRKWHK